MAFQWFRKFFSGKSVSVKAELFSLDFVQKREIPLISSKVFLFCSSLPPANTRCVRSTIKLCTVHSLSSALSINLGDIKLIYHINFFGNTENHNRGCWVRSANATSVLCRPLLPCPSKVCQQMMERYQPFLVSSTTQNRWRTMTTTTATN